MYATYSVFIDIYNFIYEVFNFKYIQASAL